MTKHTSRRAFLNTLITSIGAMFVLSVKAASSPEANDLIASFGLLQVEDKIPAPDFTLKNLENEEVSLSDYQGKIVLLNFMDTGCHWCRKEMPHLQKLYEQFKDKDFVIVVVFADRRGAAAVVPFMKESGYTFFGNSGLLDPTGRVNILYRVTGTPTAFLIDRDRSLIGWGIGYRQWSSKQARDLIAGLLK